MKFEGKNAVREAILGKTPIEKLMANKTAGDKVFNDIITLAKQAGIKVQFVDMQVLNKLSYTKKHQGLIAIGAEYNYCSVDQILTEASQKNQPPFILILDEINDPHNLGSIIRVCECLGVHGIIIGKDRSCPVNETVIKVSAGAINYVKVAKVTNINREIEYLRQKGVWIYALELGGEDIASVNLSGPVGMVLGSEGKGVSSLTKKLCDGVVTIPMFGQVNSLNASVACGIGLYEITKQRK